MKAKWFRGRYVWGVVGLAVAVLVASGGPGAVAGEKDHGYMGVYMQELTRDIRAGLELDVEEGILVSGVEEDSPAEKAGIEDGDVIVAFNGEAVNDPDDLRDMVMDMEPGEKVDVVVIRDGDRRTVTVELGERSPRWTFLLDDKGDGHRFHTWRGDGEHTFTAMLGGPRLGIRAAELNDDLAEYFDAEAGKGVLVLDVIDDSIAEKAGVKAGDVIQKIDDDAIDEVSDVGESLSEFEEGDEFKVTVLRKGRTETLDATMDDQSIKTFWSNNAPRVKIDRLPHFDRDDVHDALDELRDEIKKLKQELKELKDDA